MASTGVDDDALMDFGAGAGTRSDTDATGAATVAGAEGCAVPGILILILLFAGFEYWGREKGGGRSAMSCLKVSCMIHSVSLGQRGT